MDLRKLLGTLGVVIFVLAIFMSTALPWAWIDSGKDGLAPWLLAIGVTAGPGLLLALWGRPKKEGWRRQRGRRGRPNEHELSRREALAVVALSWVLCAAFGAIPFLTTGMVAAPVDAFFEAVSGVTTTGSTILSDIEAQSRAVLWWRALLQWLGGMGIIVFFLAIFPQVGGSGRKLFDSEVPGPEKEQLRPRIAETSAILWRIYGGLTALAALVYLLEGMSVHEAICHAFSTVATGGFSTRNASIGSFDSALIEMTCALFMCLGGVNFALYFTLLRGRSLKVFKDAEFLVYLTTLLVFTGVITLVLLPNNSGNVLEALRDAAFQVVSISTSTGFSTADFTVWPPFAQVLLLLLMFVGGMAGSTAGGFKLSRLMIVAGHLSQEVRRSIHPRAIFTTRIGSRAVPDKVVRAVLSLLVLAVITLGLGTALLTLWGLPMAEAFSSTLTAFSNGGPGLGAVGPTAHFGNLPGSAKMLMASLMIIGRLEFFTALALLTPGFWTGR
jgi:trk system potassium uptake protein TrkH